MNKKILLILALAVASGFAIAHFDKLKIPDSAPPSRNINSQDPPLLEQVPPDENESIQKILNDGAALMNRVYGDPNVPSNKRALRDAHAKAHGCVKAWFQVSNLPAGDKNSVGVFKESGRTYKAWVRLSNGSGLKGDDRMPDGRGMAIKLLDVDSAPKLLDDEKGALTQDFLMINFPVFVIRNAAEYVDFARAFGLGAPSLGLIEYLKLHPQVAELSAQLGANNMVDPLSEKYYSMTPYLLGNSAIKFSARPCEHSSWTFLKRLWYHIRYVSTDVIHDRLVSDLAGDNGICYGFLVQHQTNPTGEPVEDPTQLWSEEKAPFQEVARLWIPPQKFDSDAQNTACDNLSFTPWHSLPEHRPLGGINRVRLQVYKHISIFRHQFNHVPRAEPDPWPDGSVLPPPSDLLTRPIVWQ